MLQCSNAPMLQCSNAPMVQCYYAHMAALLFCCASDLLCFYAAMLLCCYILVAMLLCCNAMLLYPPVLPLTCVTNTDAVYLCHELPGYCVVLCCVVVLNLALASIWYECMSVHCMIARLCTLLLHDVAQQFLQQWNHLDHCIATCSRRRYCLKPPTG